MKIHLLFLCWGITQWAAAQTPVTTTLPLRTVTVAFDQAELQHQGSVTLPAGRHTVWVENVASSIGYASLQAEVSDNAELISVAEQQVRPASSVADSASLLETQLRRLEAELKGLEEEKAFLQANRSLPSGTQTGWSTELQKGAAFLRTRLPNIQTETEELTARRLRLTRLGEKLRTGGSGPRRNRVEIVLELPQPATVQLTLRYVDRQSSWDSAPEIRVPEAARELQVRIQGSVHNNSGLDWNRVALQLKNEEVDNDITRPSLDPWTMNYRRSRGSEGRIDKFVVKGTATGQNAAPAEPTSFYAVPQPVSIGAGEDYELQLPAQTLVARTEYLAVPKLSEKVFLQAKVLGWEKLYLPATEEEIEADVYYRGSFVGTTEVAPRAFNDSLEISLGYDDQIVVGRTKTEDFSGKSGLGGQHKIRLTYEINVRNRHAQPVRVRVLDQIPVSQEGDLRVKLEESTGALLDEASGKLTWLLSLAPGASRRLRFTFTVEYPKDKNVDFQRPRVVRSPKFR
ncbi:hypothetical protein HNQ93_002934 [Hymenobacter luteus]|uniref:Mucoidy inhibitor MuiA family protein n=2 Tax=Hymenobacter TaxID=89966 RepID=A0A7W9WCH7_9BACT|nr:MULTISPECIES: mucoidy inhibitor MuiA family protein [Hymenobacter]MBB4603170.1 hypothetical protein [Hymenobacter latericoloratus]MBB6060068.1 hypothetical protein [Hymenobacter luteus]